MSLASFNKEKFLWVCELNKDAPAKTWRATDLAEAEDEEDDQDYVLHNLVIKTAVLGNKAVDNERNLIALKTKDYHEKEFEQPIFSLTLGKTDCISNLDLAISARANQEVEFKLIDGTGPVFITCMHVIEITAEEDQTIMTNTDGEMEADDDESEDIEEEEEEKGKKTKNGAKNGKANGKGENGNNHAKEPVDADEEEKPKKRKRN